MTWEKGSNFVGLPDGAARKIEGWQLRFGLGNILYSLTAERGWEWFDGARNEQRFKDTVARVRELIEKQ